MVGGLFDATKIPELKRRFLFTIFMLIVYRIGIFVPVPGIDGEQMKRLFERASGTLFGIANMFSGGALENFSIFALGIMPYISMSIIMQLLTTMVPHLENLQKEGEQGRRVITRYTRIGTVCLSLFQSLMIARSLENQGVVSNPGISFEFITMVTLSAGTAFIMWLGEQISERGIGNGISLIIFAGIVARMPATLLGTLALISTGEIQGPTMLFLLIFALATIGFIVYVERTQRKIPVQYPKRAVGKRMIQATTQYLPLKLNTSGVIPPIFASSILVIPATIATFSEGDFMRQAVSFLSPGTFSYEVIFGVLIVFFCYFYTAIVFDPVKIAENLKKQGGFVPTVRPGKETEEYINTVLTRLTLWGAIYVCIICIAPTVFYLNMGAPQFTSFLGGTAVLIMVGVTLDTLSQIESHVVARNYEGFMNKSPGKIRGMGRMQSSGRLIQR